MQTAVTLFQQPFSSNVLSTISGFNVSVPVLSGLCLRNGLSSKACKSNAVPGHIATCNSKEQLIADAQFVDTLHAHRHGRLT